MYLVTALGVLGRVWDARADPHGQRLHNSRWLPADPTATVAPYPRHRGNARTTGAGGPGPDARRARPLARPAGRWREGTVVERERDGSVGVRDGKGASRSLTVDRLEVRTRGPRGARTWEPLSVRAARTEQLPLFTATPVLDEDRRR
jgi:hypothetical protein